MDIVAKTWPLPTDAKQKCGVRVLGEGEKIALLLCQKGRVTDKDQGSQQQAFILLQTWCLVARTGSGGPPFWFSFDGCFSSAELKDIVMYIP